MESHRSSNIKLGMFVLGGLFILIAGLYLIGKDTNLFSKNYALRARFANIEGLTVGNNIRYAGIQVGTVKKITILNDTVIEVTMLIEERMNQFIHRDDAVSLGTDGLMGNKLINIIPGKNASPLAQENDILRTHAKVNIDEMLEVLSVSNTNIAEITESLRQTVQQINSSTSLWTILNDPEMPKDLRASMTNVRNATAHANALVADIHHMVNDVKQGKGTAGMLLTDSSLGNSLTDAVEGLKAVEANARELTAQLSVLTQTIQSAVTDGKGTAHAILQDSVMAATLSNSLTNIETGTFLFAQNMDALRSNFLFRGYFKKLDKEQKKNGKDK